MGNLTGNLHVSGFVARMVYRGLYKMFQVVLYGLPRTVILTALRFLRQGSIPRVKRH